MSQPFALIAARKGQSEVVEAITRLLDQGGESVTVELDATQLTQLGTWISSELRKTGVQSAMISGALLYYYKLATEGGSQSELYNNLCDDLGIDDRRASDYIVMFRCFGGPLRREPGLMRRFCERSLRYLSKRVVTDATREEALERARQGEQITIEGAKQLVGSYTVDADAPEVTTDATTAKGLMAPKPGKAPSNGRPPISSTEAMLLHEGQAADFLIRPKSGGATPDTAAILCDARVLVARLERECDELAGAAVRPQLGLEQRS